MAEQWCRLPRLLMEKGGDGKVAMTKVTLRPKVIFSCDQPSIEQLESIHHRAHQECFIANSVKTEILTEIVL